MNDQPMHRLLLVEDEPSTLKSLRRLFMELDDTEVHVAENTAAAARTLKQHRIDLIISDEEMLQVEGHRLIRWVKDHYPATLRIILTRVADMEAMRHAVDRGEVYRYLFTPWDDNELLVIVRNALEFARVNRERAELTARLTELVDRKTEQLSQTLYTMKARSEETEQSLYNIFAFLDSVIAMINRETGGRTLSRQVSQLARTVAEDRKAGSDEVRLCELAAYFLPIGALSVGKSLEGSIGADGEIAPEVLDASEQLFRRALNLPELAHGIRHLREHWDGSGQPDTLSGTDIPFVSRVVRLAFDHTVAKEIHKMDDKAVRHAITSDSGRVYDPSLAARMLVLLSETGKDSTRTIPVTQLVVEMVLSHDLLLDNGMPYITAGTEITREMIESVLARVETAMFPLSAESTVQVFREGS
jgi:response regulator RpfG family c-di-GMP phosphodiesterase